MKQSQKNCLIIAHYDPAKDRNGALQELLRFSVFMRRKAFFILLLFFWHAKPGQLGQKN